MAFAPKIALLGVPSNSIIFLSINACSLTSVPTIKLRISVLILFTAYKTPFPKYTLLSRSLSSTASYFPVEAPEGTAALPIIPCAVVTSASTVGLPLESRICLA